MKTILIYNKSNTVEITDVIGSFNMKEATLSYFAELYDAGFRHQLIPSLIRNEKGVSIGSFTISAIPVLRETNE